MGFVDKYRIETQRVDVLIDRRELMKKSRERGLNLGMMEKDYVLGWVLFGISKSFPNLVFKGGTALSKIYFPNIWRLSEDLDFTIIEGVFSEITRKTEDMLELVEKKSGIRLKLKSQYQNPDYLQLKIQYVNLLKFKNWLKIDITRDIVVQAEMKEVPRLYSDYPKFIIKTESLNEILASKLRTLIERKKSRDYFDVWLLLKNHEFNPEEVKKIFIKKCRFKGIEFKGVRQFFPEGTEEILNSYWEKELKRLSSFVPRLDESLVKIKKELKLLNFKN